MAAGFTVASIYVVGWLRGRRDRYHRLGILIPFTVAAIATPLQFVAGDTTARGGLQGPAGEVRRDGGGHPVRHATRPEILFGRYDEATNTVAGGIRIPGPQLDPRRRQPGHLRPGARRVRARGPAVQRQRRALGVRHHGDDRVPADPPGAAGSLSPTGGDARVPRVQARSSGWWPASGVLTYIAIEAGWIVTEVGRQPWIVYGHLRTSDAVTQTPAARSARASRSS